MDHKREHYQREIDRAKKWEKNCSMAEKWTLNLLIDLLRRTKRNYRNKEKGPTEDARSKWFYYSSGTTTSYNCSCNSTYAVSPSNTTADATDATAD